MAMDFSTLESFSYGQRSKCADLLNSYDIFIISYSRYFSATLLAKTLRILTLYSDYIFLLYILTLYFYFIFTLLYSLRTLALQLQPLSHSSADYHHGCSFSLFRIKKRLPPYPFRRRTGKYGGRRIILLLKPRASVYLTTVREVIWGFTPSYQYRKPSMSTVWPISRDCTALYTSVVLSHR